MLLPVQAWEKSFATVPVPERSVGDLFRFVASEDNTVVNVTGDINGTVFSDHFPFELAEGYVKKMYSSFLFSHVVSSKPIALYQFAVSAQNEGADPSLFTSLL